MSHFYRFTYMCLLSSELCESWEMFGFKTDIKAFYISFISSLTVTNSTLIYSQRIPAVLRLVFNNPAPQAATVPADVMEKQFNWQLWNERYTVSLIFSIKNDNSDGGEISTRYVSHVQSFCLIWKSIWHRGFLRLLYIYPLTGHFIRYTCPITC